MIMFKAAVILQLFFGLIHSSLSGKANLRYEVTEIVDEGKDEEIKWMLMPDGRGNVQVAVLSGIEPRVMPPIESVQYYLYTRQNPSRAERRSMNETCLPVFKYFKSGRPTKLLVHGFGDNAEDSLMYPILKNAFLEKGDYNVFLVDWGKLAATPWYYTAASNTLNVGKHTASMLDHLSKSTGAKLKDFHLIGFSLGAHVVGIIGKNVKRGRIKKITALDPAQVLFKTAEKETMLRSTDADLVEVVHTSGGYLAFQKALGHTDFYPNGGSWPQPGCNLDYAAVCSHRRAYYYYEEAIRNGKGFRGVHCDSWSNYEHGKCNNTNEFVTLGIVNPPEGSYYFETNPVQPYGIYQKKKVHR